MPDSVTPDSSPVRGRRRMPVWAWFAIANVAVIVAGIEIYTWINARRPIVIAAPPPPTSAPASTKPAHPQLALSEIVSRVDPGVVLITVQNAKKEEMGLGSGFVIDASGLVATNFHVIDRASSAKATFSDGKSFEVRGCRSWDAESDLAILELASTPKGIRALPLCTGINRLQGDGVVAVGHPQGFRFTTTTGIISAVHTTHDLPQEYRDQIDAPPDNVWIQTNAAINGGNSGGPLLNLDGEVIGINTWIARGQNLGFAADIRHLIALRDGKLAGKAIALTVLTAPENEVDSLLENFATQYKYLAASAKSAWTQAGAKKIIETKHPALEFLPKALELSERHRNVPAGFHALKAGCDIASLADCPAACNALFKPIAASLLKNYLDRTDLPGVLIHLRDSRLTEVRDFLRQVSTQGKTARLKYAALLALAQSLQNEAAEKPERANEAIALYEQVVAQYGNEEWSGGRLADALAPMIFSLKNLQIGRKAPDIAGSDAAGQPFSLSEYRGKVVIVDFWCDWCPYCREMFPLERHLVEQWKGKPFAIVGVNGDDPKRLRELIADKTITWRNWADGHNGSIQQIWQIESFPTLYVLDAEGIIRYKDLRGQALADAIAKLMKKSPAPAAALVKDVQKPAGKSESSVKEPVANKEKVVVKSDAISTSLTPSTSASTASDFRVWTRRDGKTATLRLVDVDGATAHFVAPSGKEFRFGIDKLSDADQQWLKEHPR